MKDLNEIIEVLILEDNPGDYLLIEDFLLEKFKRINISHCKSIKDCKVDFYSKKEYSIILLDLILLDFEKEALLVKVQSLFKNTPIIVLTGYSDLDLARNMLAKGASDFLLKDEITPEILYKTIVYSLERESFIVGLNKSRVQYQNLFDFSPQPMWLYNVNTLLFLDVNNAAIDKYGYTLDEFKQMTISEIRLKEDLIQIVNGNREYEVQTPSGFEGIFTHIKKSGERIKVEIFSKPIEYNNQHAFLVSANDITEKFNYLQLIESQNTKLKEIAWKQSHIVRAPLSRMMGIVNLISEDTLNNEDFKYLIENLQLSAKELDVIIADIVIQTQSIKHLTENK